MYWPPYPSSGAGSPFALASSDMRSRDTSRKGAASHTALVHCGDWNALARGLVASTSSHAVSGSLASGASRVTKTTRLTALLS